MKPVRVRQSPLCSQHIDALDDSRLHKQILSAIDREKGFLLINPHRGIQIQKRKIPRSYIDEYGVSNLWKINLPGYWRMLYTVVGTEVEIVVLLLECMDHKEYDKRFNYR